MANSLLRTRNVGSPQASTSCAWGSDRQIFRSRVRTLAATLPPAGQSTAVIRLTVCLSRIGENASSSRGALLHSQMRRFRSFRRVDYGVAFQANQVAGRSLRPYSRGHLLRRAADPE